MGVIILILFFDLNTTDIRNVKGLEPGGEQWKRLYSLCIEKSRHFGSQIYTHMLLNVAFKCLESDRKSRPTLEWLSVLVRKITYSVLNYHYPSEI